MNYDAAPPWKRRRRLSRRRDREVTACGPSTTSLGLKRGHSHADCIHLTEEASRRRRRLRQPADGPKNRLTTFGSASAVVADELADDRQARVLHNVIRDPYVVCRLVERCSANSAAAVMATRLARRRNIRTGCCGCCARISGPELPKISPLAPQRDACDLQECVLHNSNRRTERSRRIELCISKQQSR
jgi:hypothetical protein